MDKNKKQKIEKEVSHDLNNEKVALLENQLKKALSDYSNLERDTNRRVEQMMIVNKMQIIRQMMNVLDALNLAIKAKEAITLNEETKLWVDGVCGILMQIEKLLEEIGATKMNINKGDNYDSSQQEAVGMIANQEIEKGKILEVVAPGYMLSEYIIRPAKVLVSSGKPLEK